MSSFPVNPSPGRVCRLRVIIQMIWLTVMILGSTMGCSENRDVWQSLFDGQSLDGWMVKAPPEDVEKGFWFVQDSMIVANSLADSSHDYVWLMTEQEYGDFELEFQFQAFEKSPGNSGVQIRSRYDDTTFWLNGPQIDIHPPGPWRCGMMWDETRGNQRWIFPDLKEGWVDPDMVLNPVEFYYADSADVWNEMRVLAKGLTVQAWLNDVLITDFNGQGILDDENHKERTVGIKGHIALQIHKNDRLKIHFKNIRIKPIG